LKDCHLISLAAVTGLRLSLLQDLRTEVQDLFPGESNLPVHREI
jgi:hypothetical protein